MNIIVSTDNQGKLYEIKEKLQGYKILSKSEAGYKNLEIIEDGNTLEENAKKKVLSFDSSNDIIIGDDTGLFVDALNGSPGIFSARYAGLGASDYENRKKLLINLEGIHNRSAFFKTVIAINYKNNIIFVEGICQGEILLEEKGEKGFGYDQIFRPRGSEYSFAEIGIDLKNKISHRALALEKLNAILKNL